MGDCTGRSAPSALQEALCAPVRSASPHLLPIFAGATIHCVRVCCKQAEPACWHVTCRAGVGPQDQRDQAPLWFALLKAEDIEQQSRPSVWAKIGQGIMTEQHDSV